MTDPLTAEQQPSGADVSRRPGRFTFRRALLVAAVLCVAASMRSPISSLGAVLADIQRDLGLPAILAGLLTSLPPLVFGLVGLTVPRLVRQVSTGRAVTGAAVLIAVGTAVRGSGSVHWLFAGTAAAMLGIAVANVLLPVVVRASFPAREGWLTGSYVSVMQIGASAGALFTVPLATRAGGWQVALAAWALPAAIGVAVWMVSSQRVSAHGRRQAADSQLSWPHLWRDPTARSLMLLFGLQSTVAYVMMGWLPTLLRDSGVSPTTAGGMVAIAIAVSIPASLFLPAWLAKRRDQRAFIWWIVIPWAVGHLGLLLAPAGAPALWSALIGFGLAAFPVVLLLIGLRSATGADTARVSAFVQGGGYLLALPGPLLFGALRDWTGTWAVPLALLIASFWPLVIHGRRAGQAVYVGQARPPA